MVAVDTAPMPVKPLAAFNQHSQQNKKAQGDGDDLDSALTMDFPDPRPSVPICGAFCRESGVSFSTDTWHSLPEAWGPPTITSTQELEALGPHIAPVLYGGLGNVLFQLATLHVYGRKHGVPVVVGYFSHWNRQFKTFAPWGGHAPPGEGVTLKDTFPALRWCSFEYKVPVPRVFNRYAFKINQPDEIVPLPDPAMLPLYLHGYFFNHYYWHHARDHVLEVLRFNPAVEEYITFMYGDLLAGGQDRSREPISLHFRLGYEHEPAKALVRSRNLPPTAFYDRVFTREFDVSTALYLVFSDNPEKAHGMMREHASRVPGLTYVVIDEDVVHTVAMMARCKHHVLTSSTLSFWGAYLDRHQPNGGRTLLHSSFFNDHGRGMIPPDFHWEVFSTPATATLTN